MAEVESRLTRVQTKKRPVEPREPPLGYVRSTFPKRSVVSEFETAFGVDAGLHFGPVTDLDVTFGGDVAFEFRIEADRNGAVALDREIFRVTAGHEHLHAIRELAAVGDLE